MTVEITGACAGWVLGRDCESPDYHSVEPVWRVDGRLYDAWGQPVREGATVYGSQLTAMHALALEAAQ